MKKDKQCGYNSFLSHPSATERAVCKIHDLATISARTRADRKRHTADLDAKEETTEDSFLL
jgi:hypothetical protein